MTRGHRRDTESKIVEGPDSVAFLSARALVELGPEVDLLIGGAYDDGRA
jgi:hypothetical protein